MITYMIKRRGNVGRTLGVNPADRGRPCVVVFPQYLDIRADNWHARIDGLVDREPHPLRPGRHHEPHRSPEKRCRGGVIDIPEADEVPSCHKASVANQPVDPVNMSLLGEPRRTDLFGAVSEKDDRHVSPLATRDGLEQRLVVFVFGCVAGIDEVWRSYTPGER